MRNGQQASGDATWLQGGFRAVYYAGEENRCPGCGRKHWILGRLTAECAFCETAMPLQSAHGFGCSPRIRGTGAADTDEAAAAH